MAYSKSFETGHALSPLEEIHTIEGEPEYYSLETEIPRVLEEAFGEGWSVDVVEDIDTNFDPRNLTGPEPSYSIEYHITATSPDDDEYEFTLSLMGETIELTADETDGEVIKKLENGINKLIEEIKQFKQSGASMEQVYGASEGGRRRKRRGTRKHKGGRRTRKGARKSSRKHMKKTHKRRGGSRRRGNRR